jgi:dihydroorotate dehydrogenase electron transfer subunit
MDVIGYVAIAMFEMEPDIIFNRKINSRTWLMGLRSREIAGGARAGQFVMIRVRPGTEPLLRRPFSICGVRDDLFLILYRVVGKGTAIMTRAEEGERLSVLGPLGLGFRPGRAEGVHLLVGGGIGVAPLLFMTQTLKDRRVEFMAGFGTASEIITPAQIGLPAARMTLATDDGTEGHGGLVTDLLGRYLEEHRSEREALTVFACGPRPMLREVARRTRDLNVSCQVSLEAGMACGLGACQGCSIHAGPGEERAYYHVCRDGPVFPVEVVDWDRL